MSVILKFLAILPMVVYYTVESIIISLIPKRFRYKDISGEIVLITGAGSGIGREMAKKFAKLGARLVLLDINMKGLKETESMIGKDVFVYECDVSKRENVYAVAAKIKDEVGSVNILVNNAGIVTGKRFLDCPDDMIRKTFDVNALAHFWTCKAFLPDMIAANHGHLVSIASLAGLGGAAKLSDYCASKFAAVGFEESLRLELSEDGLEGINSTVVCPYLVTTGLFDGFSSWTLKGLTPDYVADEIISAVLVNQEVILVPSFFGVAVILKLLLPRKAMRQLYDFAGITTSMENFKGRQKAE